MKTLLLIVGIALSLSLLTSTTGQTSGTAGITLRSGPIDTSPSASSIPSPDDSLRLVRFSAPIDANQRRALESSVERIITYFPDHAYLVRACRENCSDLAARARDEDWANVGAVWSGPYLAPYKISPEIARSSATSDNLRPVMLHLFPDVDLGPAARAIQDLLGKTPVAIGQGTRFSRVRVLLTDAEIASKRLPLADLGAVFWIERESRKVLLNDTTIWVGQSGLNGGQSTPVFDHGLHGEGQVVAVLDTGLDADSCYFLDSSEGLPTTNCNGAEAINNDQRKVLAVDFLWDSDCNGGISSSEWDNQGHGTHVAGTVGGDDETMPGVHNNRDGMAPAAKLIIQDGGYASGDDCADLPGLGCPVIDLKPIFEQSYNQGARIHTNSWGDEENDPAWGEYTVGSQDADQFMWDHPDFLLLFAAGNNNGQPNSVDSPSTAKSPISVGSTGRASGADSISGFSSHGPTDDGRIKPDLTNPGSGIVSAANNGSVSSPNCTDVSNSGTSMATPGVAGFAALTRQYYTDGYYPTGSATPGDAFTPSAALVKATLINSATQMANEGTIPNPVQGWGRVQLDRALHFSGDDHTLWVEDDPVGFANGSGGTSIDFSLIVQDSSTPLEVTLGWTDFPSTPAASTNLVNDLNLVVSGPDGTFRGNVFSNGVSTTGGSPDALNTIENVLIGSPTPGLWTVSVEALTVPSGTSQPFALVATGKVASCEGPGSARVIEGTGGLVLSGGGDDDPYLDNCEAGRLEFSVGNHGNGVASNVTIVSVSSPSHPGTLFAAPSWSAGSLAACDIDTTGFVDIVSAEGLASGDTLLVDVEITNDEMSPTTQTTTLEIPATEFDLTPETALTYDFESDLEGWTVPSGVFVRDTILGGAGGSSAYLRSSSQLANQCDSTLSPPLYLTATSTLSLATHYDIEPGEPTWYDRANVSIVDDGATQVLEPSSGRLYDVEPNADNGPCSTNLEPGWAGSQESWATSTFDAVDLDAVNRTGRPVQFQVDYATDGGLELDGFRFDQFTLTDVLVQGPDLQPNTCEASSIFADGFETGDTTRWSN